MAEVEFSKEEKELITKKIQFYFKEELDREIGQFDAQAILERRVEDISEAIYELEKTTDFRR